LAWVARVATFKWAARFFHLMAPEESMEADDEKVLRFIHSYDFEKYAWDTAEAASELGMTVNRVYQALYRIQRGLRNEVYFYYKDGGLRIVTA
jgi:hypothetical protein